MVYKRELIINNGSLTSYKKLLKVSDVCQLLDTSKYPATTTINGVTFTNNGDGTITVNGTATANVRYSYDFLPNWNDGGGLDVISKFLYIGCPAGGSNSTYGIYNGWVTGNYQDIGSGAFTYTTSQKYNGFYRFNYNIGIRKGYTANNLVFKPMCINLTEMYGAGNEPATVAEFKAKFPNEMYDYSPRCWVKSYKTGLIAKTKNLFDSNNIDKQWLGISYKTVANGKILLNGTKEAGYNIYAVTNPNITLPAGTYTLSCRMLAGNIEGYDITFNRWIFFSINGSSGAYRCDGVGKVGDYTTKTFTLTEDTLLSSFDITAGYTNDFNIDNVMIECQLEKGSTATDYVPYGYL